MSEIMDYQHEKPSIMILNDDCLYNIMAKLNIIDLIQLKQVNKRLNDLCLVQFSRFKELNFPAYLPKTWENWQFRKIVDLCSSSVTSMEVALRKDLTITNILDVVKKCSKLESLKVIKPFHYRWIRMQKGLKIGRRIISRSVRQLDLCGDIFSLDNILIAFPNLEELRFRSVIEEKYIRAEALPRNKLKSLEIFAHHAYQSISIKLVSLLPMLEEFRLACTERTIFRYPYPYSMSQYMNFSGNKKLKEIRMKHWELNDNDLLTLGNSIYGQLETFGFHCCANITEEGFQSFLRSQPNLKTVVIRSYKDEPGSYAMRCLNYYIESRPAKEEPLNVITNCNTSEFSTKLNIVQASGRFECAFCDHDED